MGGIIQCNPGYQWVDLLHESSNDAFERGRFKRRGNVLVAAGGEREFTKLLGAVRGDCHDRHGPEPFETANLPRSGETVELRHLHVHDDQIGRLGLGEADGLHTILGLNDAKPAPFKPRAQKQTGIVEVIDNENCASGIRGVGRVHVVLISGGPLGGGSSVAENAEFWNALIFRRLRYGNSPAVVKWCGVC